MFWLNSLRNNMHNLKVYSCLLVHCAGFCISRSVRGQFPCNVITLYVDYSQIGYDAFQCIKKTAWLSCNNILQFEEYHCSSLCRSLKKNKPTQALVRRGLWRQHSHTRTDTQRHPQKVKILQIETNTAK